MKKSVLVIIALCSVINLSAIEFPKVRFGKVTKAELEMKSCDLDSGAHAMYLINDGYTEVTYGSSRGWISDFTHYSKIKVFDKEGDSYATIKIPYYVSSSSSAEIRVSSIKACTYNLVDGKIVKTKLSSKDIFKENTGGDYWEKKFSMPNVQPGSVIEVEYRKTSDFIWELPVWAFQKRIPTQWSRYETSIPEYFEYDRDMKGYISLRGHERTSSTGQIGSLEYSEYGEMMIAKDVPAYKDEPYVDSDANYISSVKFELRSEHPPMQVRVNHTTSWEKIGKDLSESDYFGLAIRNANYWDNEWKDKEGPKDTLAYINEVYNTIKNRVAWNGRFSKYTSKSLRKVLSEGAGNSADINLMLVSILHEEGIKADPVCLRLRESGRLPYTRPSLSSLNYVVACVELKGQLYLLDATEDFLPFGVLPERCINGKGIRFGYDRSITQINLNPNSIYGLSTLCSLKLDTEGNFEGSVDYKRSGYAGIKARERYDVGDPDKKMRKRLEASFPEVEIDSCCILNKDSINKALVEKFTVKFPEAAQMAGDLMFINPSFIDHMEENPFKLEERMYPVNYGYPIKESTIMSLELPEGYAVEELPKSMRLALPGNSGMYVFMVQEMGNRLQIVQQFAINKHLFLSSEYLGLKAFYDQMVSKQNEQIVLKKI